MVTVDLLASYKDIENCLASSTLNRILGNSPALVKTGMCEVVFGNRYLRRIPGHGMRKDEEEENRRNGNRRRRRRRIKRWSRKRSRKDRKRRRKRRVGRKRRRRQEE